MNHLLNILRGVKQNFMLLPTPRHYQNEKKGFSVDAMRMRGDFVNVGQGIRESLKRESTNYSAR